MAKSVQNTEGNRKSDVSVNTSLKTVFKNLSRMLPYPDHTLGATALVVLALSGLVVGDLLTDWVEVGCDSSLCPRKLFTDFCPLSDT